MRDCLRTVLFATAFCPALLTLAFVKYQIRGWTIEVLQLLAIGAIGCALPFLIMTLVDRQGEAFRLQIRKIELNDFMLFVFVASYLAPWILRGADVPVGIIFWVLFAAGIVLLSIFSLPAHPLLRVMRFKFYKAETSNGVVFTVISRRIILDPRDIRSLKRISPTMLVEDNLNV